MPGIDSAVQIMKYSNQPVCDTMKPLDADASVRGTDFRHAILSGARFDRVTGLESCRFDEA